MDNANGISSSSTSKETPHLRTSSLATLKSNESNTPTSPSKPLIQYPEHTPENGKDENVYVSIRPALNNVASDDTLVTGEEEVLSTLSLPRSVDSAKFSKIDERLESN